MSAWGRLDQQGSTYAATEDATCLILEARGQHTLHNLVHKIGPEGRVDNDDLRHHPRVLVVRGLDTTHTMARTEHTSVTQCKERTETVACIPDEETRRYDSPPYMPVRTVSRTFNMHAPHMQSHPSDGSRIQPSPGLSVMPHC